MSTLEPGTKATLTGMGSARCVVVRDMGDRGVRVAKDNGVMATVPRERLRITPEPTALGGDYAPTAADQAAWDEAQARGDAAIPPDLMPILRQRQAVRQREPRLESPQYLAYVRRHACCHCGAPGPSEPHHWSHHGGSTGMKPDDFRTVPLCQEHHRYWHDHGMLPGLDRVASEALFVETQYTLLRGWVHVGPSLRRPEVVVDALVEAMRKMEANNG
jgi:hypothetical protein